MLRALGGPGPSTLLFRQLIAPSAPTASRHASKSVKAGHDGHVSKKWSRPPKPINKRDTSDRNADYDTAKPKPKETKARKPSEERSPATSKGPPPRSKPSKSKQRPQNGNIGRTEPKSASAPRPPIPSDVILLPPPLNHSDVTFQVTRLREATESGNFGHVLDVWAHLLDLQAMRAVPADDFASISELLVNAIHNEPSVGRWVFDVPELYDRVRHLAVEAAANDQFKGLFELCLKLIKVRPADIVPIFADYKTRFRAVHGLNVEDLVSFKREERVAARIGGKGVLPLSLVTIAAHTVLESLDSTAIFSFTDTAADLRGSTMLRAYHAPIQRRMDRKLHRKFYQNIDKVRLAILCFHSAALKARISGYASIVDGKSVRQLYDQIMDGTKGPDRFIMPVHGFSMTNYDVVPFSDAMWATFIWAFTRVNDQRSIMGLVSHDYPTRAGEPPPLILAHAMKSLGKLQARVRHFTPPERQEMVAQADKLWDQLVDMGADSQAPIVRYRIEALWRMGRYKECENTYTTYRAHLYKVEAPDTELMLCWAFLPYLYRTKQVARAVEMIRGYRSTDPILESYMLSNHIGHILDSRMTHADKRKLLVEILRSKHRDVIIKPMAWGEVLSFLLNGGQSVESACSTVMQSMDKTGNFTMDIHQLLKGLHEFHWEVTPKTIEASVYILENLGTDFLGLASYDIYVWGFVMETIAAVNSRIASASVRHELIQRVVACSRLDPVNSLAPMERLAMRAHFGRPDGEGVAAALYWFDKIEALGKLVSFDCRLAIESLVKFGYPEKAREIVDMAPKDKPWFKHVSRLAAELGLNDNTTPTADLSSIPKTEADPEDEDIDRLADSDALAAEGILEAAEKVGVDGDPDDVVEEYGRDGERP